MKVNLPIALTDEITGTLSVSITIGKETRAHALRKGIDLEEVENAASQRLQQVVHDLASILGTDYEE